MDTWVETVHDQIVGFEAVLVSLSFEWGLGNYVLVVVVVNYDVLVATTGAYREVTGVVGVGLAYFLYPGVEFVGAGASTQVLGLPMLSFGIIQMDALERLLYVSVDDFVGSRAVFGGVGMREARPHGVFPGSGF